MSEDDIINSEEEEEGSPVDNEVLSMEEVLELTKAKPEKRDYPWFVIRKMEHAMEIGGNPKSHICVECLENVVQKKKRTANIGIQRYAKVEMQRTRGSIWRESMATPKTKAWQQC